MRFNYKTFPFLQIIENDYYYFFDYIKELAQPKINQYNEVRTNLYEANKNIDFADLNNKTASLSPSAYAHFFASANLQTEHYRFDKNINYVCNSFKKKLETIPKAHIKKLSLLIQNINGDAGFLIYPDKSVVMYRIELSSFATFSTDILYFAQSPFFDKGWDMMRTKGEWGFIRSQKVLCEHEKNFDDWYKEYEEDYRNISPKFKFEDAGFFNGLLSQNDDLAHGIVNDVHSILLLKKYADIEILEVNKTRKKVKKQGEKILSEIKSNIQVLDSNWFTTFVRSEGFNVKGHFALRAYGEGRKKRKLVWINPYEKSGYTRTAKLSNS